MRSRQRFLVALSFLLSALLFISAGAMPTGTEAQDVDASPVLTDIASSVAPAMATRRAIHPPASWIRPRDVVWAARLCAHEATWAGGVPGSPGVSGTADCGGIIQVLINRREARWPGEGFEQVVSHTSPRFYGGTTDRPWARVMPATPLRADPVGWPATWPHATNYTDRWHAVYQQTWNYMTGATPLPCDGHVDHWFGRRCDGDRIAAMLATGRWAEVECQSHYTNAEGVDSLTRRTVNAFLEPVRPTEVDPDATLPEDTVAFGG